MNRYLSTALTCAVSLIIGVAVFLLLRLTGMSADVAGGFGCALATLITTSTARPAPVTVVRDRVVSVPTARRCGPIRYVAGTRRRSCG